MSTASWKEHFQATITGYDPVEAQGLTELGFAVINQKIDEQEYLSWARSTYEMLSVDMNFFQKNPPPIALISKLREVYPWGPEILPVAEWDGHTIILTLEKPTTPIPEELKPILLLAPVSKMSEYWQASLTALESSNSGEFLEIEPLVEVLEGINLEPSTAVTAIDFSNLRAQTVLAEKPAEIPTRIDIEDTPAIVAIAAEPVSVIPEKAPAIPSIPTLPTESIKIVSEDTKPAIKATPQILSVASPKAEVDAEKVRNCLAQYKHIYDSRCFLKVDSKAKTFQVTVWPEDSTNITVTPTSHDLQADSFIKIVAQTQKPYHGHVVKTLNTDKFFKEVNGGHLPENVTAIPLIKDGDVIGVILGWGPLATYNMQTLRELENIVQNLGAELGFTPVENAA